jgi:integrase
MARELNRLTALEVKNAQPADKPKAPKLLADGGGLYLQVMPQGSKSFLFRYTFNGRQQTLGLGPTHTVGLAEARQIAQAHRAMVLNGVDPKVARERQREDKKAVEAPSFQWCAERYIEAHKDDWSNAKHAHQWHQSLQDYAFPKIGLLSVRDIDVHHVMDVLKPIWGKKTETATRLRGRIERILGWAAISGYRGGENPARWQAYLSELLPKPRKVTKVKHHPAIPHHEIAHFLEKLRAQSDSVAVRALEFLTLTATRTGEVIGACWSEFDIPRKVWTIPAVRMKAKRPHIVPLSERAVEIVKSIQHLPDEEFVFRGVKHGMHISNMAMLQVMRRMKLDQVPHGMRSTFRDWAADMTDFPRELAEAALAHVVGDKTEAAYLRSDRLERRRTMMAAWADYCSTKGATAQEKRGAGAA